MIEEFRSKGFVKCISKNNQGLIKLRELYGEHLKILNFGNKISAGRTGSKYGIYEIFGNKICYYFDERRSKEFVNYLVEIFYDKNPNPDKEIRKAFTRMLHAHRLHWFGCVHSGKPRYDIKNK